VALFVARHSEERRVGGEQAELQRCDRLADAAIDIGLLREIGERRMSAERRERRAGARADIAAACVRERDLRMTDLVERCFVRASDEIGRSAEREERQRKAGERGDRGVLEERVLERDLFGVRRIGGEPRAARDRGGRIGCPDFFASNTAPIFAT
jgi:hypothetical protein